MPHSVLEAIKLGLWDYEPTQVGRRQYPETGALPGSHEKLDILAQRVAEGLPLWHPSDRRSYDDQEE